MSVKRIEQEETNDRVSDIETWDMDSYFRIYLRNPHCIHSNVGVDLCRAHGNNSDVEIDVRSSPFVDSEGEIKGK